MPVKLTSKNRLTMPKTILPPCLDTEYSDVADKDVADAVSWARPKSGQTG